MTGRPIRSSIRGSSGRRRDRRSRRRRRPRRRAQRPGRDRRGHRSSTAQRGVPTRPRSKLEFFTIASPRRAAHTLGMITARSRQSPALDATAPHEPLSSRPFLPVRSRDRTPRLHLPREPDGPGMVDLTVRPSSIVPSRSERRPQIEEKAAHRQHQRHHPGEDEHRPAGRCQQPPHQVTTLARHIHMTVGFRPLRSHFDPRFAAQQRSLTGTRPCGRASSARAADAQPVGPAATGMRSISLPSV